MTNAFWRSECTRRRWSYRLCGARTRLMCSSILHGTDLVSLLLSLFRGQQNGMIDTCGRFGRSEDLAGIIDTDRASLGRRGVPSDGEARVRGDQRVEAYRRA